MTCDTGRSGVRLSATNADGVVSWSNHRIAVLAHHAQIALLQLEMNFLACTRIEVNSLKSSKSDEGCTLNRREFEVQLHDLVAWNLSGIGHRYICLDRLSRSDALLPAH